MITPKHATDAEINDLFELLPDLGHDVFEQRRKNERPANAPRSLTTVEINPEILEVAKNG